MELAGILTISLILAIALRMGFSAIQDSYAKMRRESRARATRLDGPMLLLLILFTGCAHNSLAPGVERACAGDRCYMIGNGEQIDNHCKKTVSMFDDGTTDPDKVVVLACTKYKPDSKWKFRIWLSWEHMESVVHEECHIQIWLGKSPGPHTNCHNFGIGREKKRL